jgi:hypothetical protein
LLTTPLTFEKNKKNANFFVLPLDKLKMIWYKGSTVWGIPHGKDGRALKVIG